MHLKCVCRSVFPYDDMYCYGIVLRYLYILLMLYILKDNANDSGEKLVKKVPSSKHQNNILFVRIIGNALPPLHSTNQGISNLLFTLQNEMVPQGVTRIWILNRIIDTEVVNNITSSLEQSQCVYFIIRFSAGKYLSVEHDYNYFPSPMIKPLTPSLILASSGEVKTNLSYSFKSKNLYVMNNNGARNYALRLGVRRGYRWVFPWDGNSFVTSTTWPEILSQLAVFGQRHKYFVSYMTRVTNCNEELFLNGLINATEEPQIIFR